MSFKRDVMVWFILVFPIVISLYFYQTTEEIMVLLGGIGVALVNYFLVKIGEKYDE